MKYDEIIAGFRALHAGDFNSMNVDARGWERLSELTGALMSTEEPNRGIPELFAVMERLPDTDLGSPGPLVHTLERLHGYEVELELSVRRQPAVLSVWMVNRILNTALSENARQLYMSLLNEAFEHPNASEEVRIDARRFIEHQMHKTISTDC